MCIAAQRCTRECLRRSSAHASPAHSEWLTVRTLPAYCQQADDVLIVALSLCSFSSKGKVMLETLQQPKPLSTVQAAHPLSLRQRSDTGHQSRPFPIMLFFPPFKAVTLQPLSSEVSHSNTCSFWVFSMVTHMSRAAWFACCTTLQRLLGCFLVFWGADSRIWPWPTHHRFLSVLVTPDVWSGYKLGSKCLSGRDFYRLLSLAAISNLQSHTLNQKTYHSLGEKMLLTQGLQLHRYSQQRQ